MPWIIDENGHKKYKLSVYAKDDLPTWSEVYNEWYKGKQILYDPDVDHEAMDPYWKIPHKKYLIATVCNQFNKMLYEDGMKIQLIDLIHHIYYNVDYINKIKDVLFVCEPFKAFTPNVPYENWVIEQNAFLEKYSMDNIVVPPIYTLQSPSGKPNPFIVVPARRIMMSDLRDPIYIYTIYKVELCNGQDCLLHASPFNNTSDTYNKIIDFMMKQFREYFEGEIGWKDEDGNVIESDIRQLEYDPAL